ncbi:MAG: ABC transporter permease [Gemmatimonadales bacterium]|nr:ABC transporter permease [Gemmatimonadales bacterium]MBA3553199.1 ABC transporter permease [Gemmatimonadales bacterium]
MPFLEALRMALRTLRAQKLKSFFSLIGVLIGVTFLIAVVSIVQGMNHYMVERFANTLIGANTFELRQRPSINMDDITDDVWLEWLRRPRISYEDADYVRDRIRTPATFAKFCEDRVDVHYEGRVARGINLVGSEETYFQIRHYELSAGRAFTAQEVRNAVPVLVVGQEVADKLLAGVDPVNKQVQIAGLPYRVIGVVEKQGTLFGMSLDKFAIMPFNAPARRLICPINILDALIVRTDDPTHMLRAQAEAEAAMRGRRQLKPSEGNNFAFQTAEGALSTWQKINGILLLALPGLVAISLVVGGIVIMNIMLMAVSERTREIGIRKALGARRRDILAQFVVEAATLSAVGAALGIGFGLALAFVVKSLTPLPAAVAPWSVVAGVVLGITVGVAAGVYPASRASRLDPIDALRAE